MFELNQEEESALGSLNAKLKPEGVTLLAYDYNTSPDSITGPFNLRVSVSILGNQSRASEIFEQAAKTNKSISPLGKYGFAVSYENREARQSFLKDISQRIVPKPA